MAQGFSMEKNSGKTEKVKFCGHYKIPQFCLALFKKGFHSFIFIHTGNFFLFQNTKLWKIHFFFWEDLEGLMNCTLGDFAYGILQCLKISSNITLCFGSS